MTTSKSATKAPDDVFIAGRRTIKDWKAFQPTLILGGDTKPWEKAAKDYFEARLVSRYLTPIKTLQQSGSQRGEGFSIVAVQCSLIEFLESTVQGTSYRYVPPKGVPPLGQYEYSNSGEIFVSFLVNRPPFKNDFTTQDVARDFYEGVRCGLLHEARTKNGWMILAKNSGSQTIDANQKIIYRDNFQTALLAFVEWYKGALPSDRALQEAFIRKFDSLCL
jgi:hypothetical protein